MELSGDRPTFANEPTSEIERLLEWAALIAAQLHRNLPCVVKHRRALISKGEHESRVEQAGMWNDSSVFSPKERAVMGLSEAISNGDSEERIYPFLNAARQHFSPDELVRLSASVIAVNEWMEIHGKAIIRVLVVEDNPDDQILLNRQLQKTSFKDHVLFLSDPRIAMGLIQGSGCESFRQNLVAIFLDINLPHISGIDVLRSIRSIQGWEDFPVVVMSTDSRPEIAAACLELKVKAFVSKPVTMDDFTRVIAPLFHRPRLVNADQCQSCS